MVGSAGVSDSAGVSAGVVAAGDGASGGYPSAVVSGVNSTLGVSSVAGAYFQKSSV